MRLLFLALDRPDLQFVAKDISRAMASPTVNAYEPLKAVCRYMIGAPRVVWQFVRQSWPGKVWGLSDSNWAACPLTRKSTSAAYLALGRHPILTATSTQGVIALSSGEAEFYSAVRCACRVLGLTSSIFDLKLEVEAELVTDSTACKGLCSRRGAEKIRHIHCPTLWLQHAIARRLLSIRKRDGKDLVPDVGTKAGIASNHMWRLLGSFGIVKAEGRAKLTLDASTPQA